ncbi:RT0821/Lpp0805 family surface protein [Chelativorans sp. YIM 93263]|uniref:RT0821/Lpp0805 family surface protein n=1 Tax=Chelativorans sp. YIM 93263 TaxID=2906648 RepID=UPI002378D74A|nr:RT0821/Lpp0805 family surface protein [Chelativorans sp. YIM 93263]
MKLLPVVICFGLVLQGCAVGGLGRNAAFGAGDAEEAVSGIVGGGLVMRAGDAGLTQRERVTALKAEYRALETAPGGQMVTWRDDNSGHHGTVTARQPYRVGSQDCRAYTHTIEADGRERTLEGTACRNQDGSWTLLD